MDRNGALGDRQSQAGPPGTSVAVQFHAIEGAEDLLQREFGNTLAMIPDSDDRVIGIATGPEFNSRSGRAVLQRIAKHVLQRSPQQLGITHQAARFRQSQRQFAASLASFNIAAVGDLRQYRSQVDGFRTHRCGIDFRSNHVKQFIDQIIHARNFRFNAIECAGRSPPGKLDCKQQPG
jgi:hypothetical protein